MAERLQSGKIDKPLDLTEQFDDLLLDQFARVEIRVDLANISEKDQIVIDDLVKASRIINEIFLLQQGLNVADLANAINSRDSHISAGAREYFRIMQSPWDQLDNDRPFIGIEPRPLGAGYYPKDMTKEEIESWVANHPEMRKELCSATTIVERDGPILTSVPYSVAYRQLLKTAAEHLRNAATMSDNDSLKYFLETRALAFENDDYVESDMAWMDLDSLIEPTIGPYETYDDKLMGTKAAFESYVAINNSNESAKLEKYKARLPWLENNLPIPDEHKNTRRNCESPIRIVDVVYASGYGNNGVKAVAYNLPNDERVREAKGSKNVLMRNIIRAKYDAMLMPIAEEVLSEMDASNISFEAFFQFVLHHELSHGLGPSVINVDGRETNVRSELKEHYAAIEEAKADTMSIYNTLALIDTGDIMPELRESVDATYVAGLFRTIRFGIKNDHCLGVLCQFNYLFEQGALEIDDNGLYKTVSKKFPEAISALLHDILMIEANGDYSGAKAFLDKYSDPTASTLKAIGRLGHIPVDLDIVYKV